MSYLIVADFKKTIQSDNLMQIIGSDLSMLNDISVTAQAEANTYLKQQYLTPKEFTDTGVYNPASPYNPGDRIYLDAAPYNPINLYAVNDLVLVAGIVYFCTIAISTAQPFLPQNWASLGLQYTMFHASYPFKKFDLYGIYKYGDRVYYNGTSYTCILPTIVFSHEEQLQSNSNQSIQNFFPTDANNGATNWRIIAVENVPAGVLPTDKSKWTLGDNRNPLLVMHCCDIALYHIHSRIAPRNIPELRVKRYDDSKNWLKMASRGEISVDLPVIQPLQGGRVRYSTQVKQINNY